MCDLVSLNCERGEGKKEKKVHKDSKEEVRKNEVPRAFERACARKRKHELSGEIAKNCKILKKNQHRAKNRRTARALFCPFFSPSSHQKDHRWGWGNRRISLSRAFFSNPSTLFFPPPLPTTAADNRRRIQKTLRCCRRLFSLPPLPTLYPIAAYICLLESSTCRVRPVLLRFRLGAEEEEEEEDPPCWRRLPADLGPPRG
jgi:hypothetical protein